MRISKKKRKRSFQAKYYENKSPDAKPEGITKKSLVNAKKTQRRKTSDNSENENSEALRT